MNRTPFLVFATLALLPTAGGPRAATVRFDVGSGRPIVQLTVNGRGPFPFVFDTGSPSLLVMPSLVDELGLEVVGHDTLQSPAQGTPVPVDVVRVDSIALGDASAGRLTAKVLDMEGHGLGRGVVGPALFRENGPITIDFGRNTITIGGDAPAAGVEHWLPFGASAPLLDVPVRIGDVVIPGHLDTGNFDVLSVPSAFEKRLALSGPVRTIGRARTADAEFEIRAAPIDGSARIGDAEIPLHQVLLSDLPVANVGTAALRGLVLHIDWARERFALTGQAEPVTRWTAQAPAAGDPGAEPGERRVVVRAPAAGGDGPRFGVRAIPSADGTIEVAGTDPGSGAEAIGLLTGDRIVAINGTPTGEIEPTRIRAELARADLVLTVEREGRTITLKR